MFHRSTCAALAILLATGASRWLLASEGPPWRDRNDLPLPDGALSVVAMREDVAILREPSATADRRGTPIAGVRLPLFAAKRGSGCASRWINVGPWAWICQDALSLDPGAPIGFEPPPPPPGGLPFHYYYVGRDGTQGYSRLADAEQVAPDREFDSGFAVALVEEALRGNERYGRTHHGLWIPLRDLVPISSPSFQGVEVPDGKLDFGWTVEDKVSSFDKEPSAKLPTPKATRTLARFERVNVLDTVMSPAANGRAPSLLAYRVGDAEWVRARDVRRPTVAAPPASLGPGERWIDVDLATQTLVAYQGATPVFATLVSTGRGPEGTDTATPKGEFRIWVKLQSSNMDNLEDEDAQRYYAIEDVPYVQYFSGGVGLHGAFWHRSFGYVRSHGCVNLSTLDAQRLFAFTRPHLPSGWSAVLPTPHELGTLIRVR